MAYRSRRVPARRSSPARRSYGSRSRVSRTSNRSRSSAGKRTSARQQVVKIVVEQLPPSAIARPEGGPLQTIAPPPKRSKF